MTTEANDAGQPDAEDTAAVLAHATGDKTYLTPADEKPPAEEPKDEKPGDDAPADAETEAEAKEPKPKKTAQERIDELTRARRDAERDRDFYREQALRAQAPKDPAPAAQNTDEPKGDGKPDPTTYEGGQFDPQYIEDLTDWKVAEAVKSMTVQQRAQSHASDAAASFQTRSKELYPDGEPDGLKAFRTIQTLPVGVLEVIAASDIGPKIAEHLGDNPAELQRLAGLSPAIQARELTRLETSLTPPPKASPKTATEAPEPPPQARGAGGQFKVQADTDDFAAFEKQYGTAG